MDGSSLENFSNIVLQDAKSERDKRLAEINEQKRKQIAENKNEIIAGYEKRRKREFDNLRRKYNEQLSEKQMEYKKKLLSERDAMINEVFSKISADVEDFKTSEQYAASMKRLVTEALTKGNSFVATVDSDDKAMTGVLDELGISHVASESPLLGGCLLTDEGLGIRIDLSYRAKFEQMRESFMVKYFAANNG